ncbi:MAG: papain-like cysteine protease family protein [Pseudomonadota bacterium]
MSPGVLDMTVPQQEQLNWCWAATTVGVSRFLNPVPTGTDNLEQGEVVNRRLNLTLCCVGPGDPVSSECNVQSGLTLPLFEAGLHQVTYANKLEFDEIKSEIDAGRPVCVRIVWELGFGQGHFAVIVGYIFDPDAGIADLVLEDSYFRRSIHTYDSFRQFYGAQVQTDTGFKAQEGAWTHSYYTKLPTETLAAKEEGSNNSA